MKKHLFFAIMLSLFPAIATQASGYGGFTIKNEFFQGNLPNVEDAYITVIECANKVNKEYYIYKYFRTSGPNFRAVKPPYWGKPLGGRDYYSFYDAVDAACE